MKRSVGLLVFTNIPSGGGERLVVVLQRRGRWNIEDGFRPESYPGCLQVTCHGKVKDEESEDSALVREIGEELGDCFLGALMTHCHHQLVSEITNDDKKITTFGALVPISLIRDYLRLSPDSGGLEYVTENDLDEIIEIVPEIMKKSGPEQTSTLAMFGDEIQTIRMGFEVFGK